MSKHASVYERNRKNPEKDRLLNVEQVMDRLNCSKRQVYSLLNSGAIDGILIGNSKGRRIFASSVEAYIERKKEAENA